MKNFNYDKMDEQTINIDIKRKFLDETGLSTLWSNIVRHVTAEINKFSVKNTSDLDEINKTIQANATNITTINNSLDSYRGYHISSLDASNNSFDLQPNTYYTLHPASSNTISISLNDNNANVTAEYVLEIDTTNFVPTLALGANISWENDDAPEFETGYKYVISIIKNSSNDVMKAVYGQYKI